jgi:hypothetical protein
MPRISKAPIEGISSGAVSTAYCVGRSAALRARGVNAFLATFALGQPILFVVEAPGHCSSVKTHLLPEPCISLPIRRRACVMIPWLPEKREEMDYWRGCCVLVS